MDAYCFKNWLPLLLICALFSARAARAEKYAFLFGGSGEEENPNNFFVPDYQNLKKSLEAKGYKVVVLYDRQPEKVPGAAGKATAAAVDAQLAQYEKTLKKGDQVMYIAHAHGADPRTVPMPSSPGRGLTGHGVSLDDGAYDSAKVVHSAKRLQARGVTSAVMDLSCYSGNTQPENPDGICAITLAAKSYVSVCAASGVSHSFTQGLIDAFGNSKLKTLEDAYLSAREKDQTPVNLPAISSFTSPYQALFDQLLDESDPSCIKEGKQTGQVMNGGACGGVSASASLANLEKLAKDLSKAQRAELSASIQRIYELRNSANSLLEKLTRQPVSAPTSLLFGGKSPVPAQVEAAISRLNPIALGGLIRILNKLRTQQDIAGLTWASPNDQQMLNAIFPYRDRVMQQMQFKLSNDPNWTAYVAQKKELESKTQALLQSERGLYKSAFDRDRAAKTGKRNPCSSYKL